MPGPAGELHIWHAPLDDGGWPPVDRLPPIERDRAAEIRRSGARERWVAARWALRGVLGHYLEQDPAEIELRFGPRGKPALAEPGSPLRFNLSHSAELALIAVVADREVGVDVERIGSRPAAFYADWTRREARGKCAGVGLGAPLPAGPITVRDLDAGPGFAAAVALAGEGMPALRRCDAEPAAILG